MFRIAVFIFFTVCIGSVLFAQNLVPNPGFENLRNKRPSMFPWQMVNTIDYFVYHESMEGKIFRTKIKDKNFKLRKPNSGVAYVGMRVWPRYSEFLIVELLEPLEAGRQYYFEMHMAFSPHANAYLRSVGASFYSFKPPYSQKKAVVDFPPQVDIYKHYGIIDTTDWFQVAGVFTATGEERFMTIGNFSRNNRDKFKRKKISLRKREAYYYIDDVALYKLDHFGYPIKGDEDLTAAGTLEEKTKLLIDNPDLPEIDEYYKIIDFPQGSTELTYEAYQKLGFIIEYLNNHPSASIYVVGYADGSDNNDKEEQLKLAVRRARNISMFISGNRIQKSRITAAYMLHDSSPAKSQPDASRIKLHYAEILFPNDPDDLKKIKTSRFREID